MLTTLPTVTCIRYILNCLRSFPQQTRLGRHGDSRLRGVGVSVHAIRVEQSFDRTFRFQFLSIHEALRLPVRPDTFSNFSSVSPCVQPAVLVLFWYTFRECTGDEILPLWSGATCPSPNCKATSPSLLRLFLCVPCLLCVRLCKSRFFLPRENLLLQGGP